MKFKNSAQAIVAGTLATMLTPPVPVPPSAWAKENLVVPDGPRAGEPWSLELTPYIQEPLDFLGPDSGVNEIAVMKSAQTGFTTLLIAALGHSIDRDPCRIGVIQPTDAALSDFNRDKLQPAIDSSKVLSAKVRPQTSRSSTGSTTYSKKYPGGATSLLIASSASDLRSKTLKKLFRDEIDEYDDDLDGQGSPLDISDARLTSFLKSREWRKADISTPRVKGASKIEERYENGDKRRWHVPCPHCAEEFVFDPLTPNFEFDKAHPYTSRYVTPCCGVVISDVEGERLVRKGRWIATDPKLGAYPSYHFDVLSSPFVPWEETAKAIVNAGDDPHKLKTLWNLWFGLPYEVKGDAPDHVKLMERREDFARGHVPARGLLLIATADIQMRGIWWKVVAYAPNRERWTIDAGYCDGSTESPDGDAFEKLKQVTLDREFPDAFGGTRTIDALGIDSGYRSHVVYKVVRQWQRVHPESGQDIVLALDGRDGWGKPAIGSPKLVDIDLAGFKVKKGCKLWPVGTWPLKGAYYADLRKEGVKAGADFDPGGYCHFGTWLDEAYFKQLTAEYLADERIKGKVVKRWKLRASERDNHWLDCAVYADALAEYLGLSSTTPDEWAALAKRRGVTLDNAADVDDAPARAEGVPPRKADDEEESLFDMYSRMNG